MQYLPALSNLSIYKQAVDCIGDPDRTATSTTLLPFPIRQSKDSQSITAKHTELTKHVCCISGISLRISLPNQVV
jgi:hypothetical protein